MSSRFIKRIVLALTCLFSAHVVAQTPPVNWYEGMGDQGITAKELHQLFVTLDAQVQPVPPQLREIAEAVLFAEDEVSVGNYSAARTRVANILNKYPFDADVWKQLNATNTEVNLAKPMFYNNFRILDEITSVALNSPAATSRRLNMTVIMQRYSRFQVPAARGGGWITAEIDQTQKTKDYSDYRQFLNLFRRYIWAITDGQLELNVRFYEVQTMSDYTYDLASNTLVRGSYSQPLSNLPAEIRNTTDFFWTVWPDYPTDPKLDGITIYAPEGMGGYQHSGSSYISPHFISHDTATGKYSISSSYMTRRAWGPEWLQHEFFHHLYNIFPEYGLEDIPHQWHTSSNWPADFVQGFEEDYYAESLKKRLRGSVPSIAARLKTAPVSELTNPGNAAPVVNAGTYTPVALAGATVVVSLDGTVTDSDTTAVVTNWSKVSGPGTVVFNNSSAVDTTATFSRPGNYVLSLSADDGLARTSSLATIQITSTNVIKYRLDVYGGTGGGEYAAGTQVMITADAAPMSQEFDKWLGNTSALANVNSASTMVTMPAADVIVTPSYKVLESLKEYVGYYVLTNPTNTWHYGWIEFSGKQLQWRNTASAKWNLLPGAQADVLVTDSTCPYGAGLNFTFSRTSGRISQFVFQGGTYVRQSPVAMGASLFTLPNVSRPVTLTAFDPQGNTMTYTVLTQPANGTLSGTAPNLTYTPPSGYTGTVSLTFKASDAVSDSNEATISITVQNNNAPTVNAGPDQTVYGTMKPWTPTEISKRVWYDANDSTTITASGGTVSQWRDKSGNNNHAANGTAGTQPGYGVRTIGGKNAVEFGLGGTKRFLGMTAAENFVDKCVIGVFAIDPGAASAQFIGSPDGLNKQIGYSATNWRIAAANNNWINDATGGVVTQAAFDNNAHIVSYEGGSTLRFFIDGTQDAVTEGRETTTAYNLQTLGMYSPSASSAFFDGLMGELIILPTIPSQTDRQKLEGYLAHKWGFANNLPAAHPYRYAPPLTSSMLTVVSLSGSVTDPDGPSLSANWSLVSTNPSGLSVQFGNASSASTTATFTQPGTYTLRLTGNDSLNTPVTDDIVITVLDALPTLYSTWGNKTFNTTFTDKAIGSNPDGDSRNNLLEFAFGTDPTLTDMGSLASDGTRHGDPVAVPESGGGFALYFLRRIDHGTTGSATYTASFSSDLGTFYDNNNTANPPVEVATSTKDLNYKVVKVPFPASLPNNQPAKFGRVSVTVTP